MPVAAVAGIGAVGSIIGGINSASAAKKAAAAQAAAAQKGIDITQANAADAKNYQTNATNEQRGNIASWINSGRAANTRLTQLMGLTPEGSAPIAQPLAPGASLTPQPAQTAASLNPAANANPIDIMLHRVPGMPPLASGNPSMIATMGSDGRYYRHGGVVDGPGTGTSDSVPIHASRGEGILTAAAMRLPGVVNSVMALNRMAGGRPHVGGRRFADGGIPYPDPSQVQPGSQAPGWGPSNPTDTTPRTQGTTLNAGNPMASAPAGPTGVMTPAPGMVQPGVLPPLAAPPTTASDTMGGGPTGVMTPNPNTGTAAAMNPATGGAGAPSDFGSLAQGFNDQFQAPTLDNTNDPGYQFRLDEGRKAIERSAAARGGLLSGGTAKALTDYGQNAASAEYGNVYDRAHQQYMDRYNISRNNANDLYGRLMGISGAGEQGALGFNNSLQAGAANYGNIDMSSADAIARLLGNQGAAQASGYAGAANAYNGMIGGLGNAASLYAIMRNGGSPGGSSGTPGSSYIPSSSGGSVPPWMV